jgi:hypothetical protein
MSFADLEARTAASVMRVMANATALLTGGASFPVVFENAYAAAMGGNVSALQPQATATSADVSNRDIGFGFGLSINDTDYKVRDMQPDGTGLTLLILELA